MSQVQSSTLLFELNEFNRELLVEAADTFNLHFLKKLLSSHESQVFTEDKFDSNWLEPWVQWVSVHTGKSSERHKVQHLGDVPDLKDPQLWEKLSSLGVTSTVWGALNASRGKAEHCRSFVPDPWTFSEKEYPKSLEGLVALPRYLAKNRVDFSVWRAMGMAFKTISALPLIATLKVLRHISVFTGLVWAFRFSYSGFFVIFEYLSFHSFLKQVKKENTQFNILFLNFIAHLQHYYWQDMPLKENRKFRAAFCVLDLIAKDILRFGFDEVLLVNALSQENSVKKENWNLYRINDISKFLRVLEIYPKEVQALMSYDATLIFDSKKSRDQANQKIKGVQVEGEALFLTDPSQEDEKKLFFRIDYSKPLDKSATFKRLNSEGEEYLFKNFFSLIAVRTGRHQQESSIFSSTKLPSSRMLNHELFNYFVDSAVNKTLTQSQSSGSLEGSMESTASNSL